MAVFKARGGVLMVEEEDAVHPEAVADGGGQALVDGTR